MAANLPTTDEAEEMRLVTTRGVGDAPLPVRYEAARKALAECAKVDECSTWAKKAAALASYARQSEDKSLEQMAMRIRARAIRRCGELLRQIPAKAHGPGGKPGGGAHPHLASHASERAKAAEAAGLSRDQAKDALRVARVPATEFEAAVESDDPPTVPELAERGTKRKPLVDIEGRDPKEFNRALILRGSISDLAADVAAMTPTELLRGSLPRHRAGLRASATALSRWLVDLLRLLEADR